MRAPFFLSLLIFSSQLFAQQVADQTFKLEGASEHFYAFAEGDTIQLRIEELTGKKIKSVEFSPYPESNFILRAYELDSVLNKTILIPKTGVYLLRFHETGLNKKICRFTLHRKAGNTETTRFDTQVNWDVQASPAFRIAKKSTQTGKKTEMLSLGGQATVSSSKFYLKKPVNAYQFTLPPNTRVYPGHDYRGNSVSTIGWEKRHNARLAGRDRAAFIALMAELHLPKPKMIDIAVSANKLLGIPHAA